MKDQVTQIVSAYARRKPVPVDRVPILVTTVHQILPGLGKRAVEPVQLRPSVAIRGSAGTDAITCLDCGFNAKMIKRHLKRAHNLTPDEYKARWALKPLVAKNYSAARSALAKSLGLGQRGSPKERCD